MGRMAKELGLSFSASLEDMRQIVSRKIEELGHEPKNMRVDLEESERGVVISLRDGEGTFLECYPEETGDEEASHERRAAEETAIQAAHAVARRGRES